jgi:hypothetical protein
MARKRDQIRSERVRWDGYRKRNVNPRWDKTFAWNDSHPSGTRFNMVWDLVTAVLNGEVSLVVKDEIGNTSEAIDAAQDLIGAFVINS